ncbi:MAG: YitT family protein [Clostridia bacterium]|nr:YitT family protein [Clostridia bacterium]
MKKKKYSEYLSEMIAFFGGAALFGVSMNMFLSPGKVVMGGVTGIASTINFIYDKIPIGVMIFALNIPLLLMNIKVSGFKSMIKTVLGIVSTSVAIDLTTFLPATLTDPLLCAILGGVTMGTGAGLLLTKGYTTGGSDLSAVLLKNKFKRLSTGRLILIIDVFVVVGAALVMKDFKSIIYSSISIFAYSASIDAVMGGSEKAKMAIIISAKQDEIAKAVSERLERGVTYLHGGGWYTKEDKEVLMCVVKRNEEYTLKQLVEKVDKEAFMILCDATEVLGMGFKPIETKSPEEDKEKLKLEKKKKKEDRKEQKKAAKLKKKEQKSAARRKKSK